MEPALLPVCPLWLPVDPALLPVWPLWLPVWLEVPVWSGFDDVELPTEPLEPVCDPLEVCPDCDPEVVPDVLDPVLLPVVCAIATAPAKRNAATVSFFIRFCSLGLDRLKARPSFAIEMAAPDGVLYPLLSQNPTPTYACCWRTWLHASCWNDSSHHDVRNNPPQCASGVLR
jgi:hypothetical protein